MAHVSYINRLQKELVFWRKQITVEYIIHSVQFVHCFMLDTET